MPTQSLTTRQEARPPAAWGVRARQPAKGISPRASTILDGIIFTFLCLLAILLPHSIKGAQHAWQLAFLVWLLKLAATRTRPMPQPLSAPLLAYIVCTGISTVLSPDPYLSWDRMKIACLLLVGIAVAQNVHRLTQVRTLIFLLVLSGLALAGFIGWQYTYGVGVRVSYILPVSPLYQAHIHHDDIITQVDGVEVHTPAQLERVFQQSPPGSVLRIAYLRGSPFQRKETLVTREQVMQSGIGSQWLQFARGKPIKAQGKLGHYVNLAEMLMQIGCMAWAMLFSVAVRRRGLQLLFGFTFVALTAALFMTETRAALAGLAAGCLITLLKLAGKRTRLWAVMALVMLLLAAAAWIRHTRGPHWLGANDPGTHFRTMMWEDGLRLIGQHPLFGVGMETIRNHWAAWNIRAYAFFHDEGHFHNDLIQIAVERGLPALAAWLWFVIAYVRLLLRLIQQWRERSRFAAGAAAGVLGSFVAYLTTALVHYNLGIESVAMVLFFYLGLAVALDRMLGDATAVDVP